MSETSVQARVFLPCLHGYSFRACTGTSSPYAGAVFSCVHGDFLRAFSDKRTEQCPLPYRKNGFLCIYCVFHIHTRSFLLE